MAIALFYQQNAWRRPLHPSNPDCIIYSNGILFSYRSNPRLNFHPSIPRDSLVPEQQTLSRIVILGGGPAARYFLDSLMGALERQPLARPDEVVLVEQRGGFATGLPYSPELVLSGHTLAFNQRVSRVEMGRRLRNLFDEHVTQLRELGIGVRLLANTTALDLAPLSSGGFSVRLSDGDAITATHAVLATGHWQSGSRLAGVPGFISSPWPAAALQDAVPPDARVAILGSALTGVDTVKTIALAHGRFERRGGELRYVPRRSARQLRMTLCSRRGWLPKVSGAGLSWAEPAADAGERYNRFLTLERIEKLRRRRGGALPLEGLYRLLGQELHQAGATAELRGELPDLTGRHLRRDLRHIHDRWRQIGGRELFERDFERARRSTETGAYIPWQSVLWEKIELLNFYYSFLDGADRRLFHHHETLLMRFLQPVHFHNAERLRALFRAGVLDLEAVGDSYVLEPGRAGEGWTLRHADGEGGWRVARHDLVVDATGQKRDIESSLSPLHQSLLGRGLIQPALVPFLDERAAAAQEDGEDRLVRLGGRLFYKPGGVHLNPDTFEAIPRGEVSLSWRGEGGGLFVLGPPALGQFLAFVGLRALWYQAHVIAEGIVARTLGVRSGGDRPPGLLPDGARPVPEVVVQEWEPDVSQEASTVEVVGAGDDLRCHSQGEVV
jgi:uncharacterized NAD(P)/FAD-binding protein YdhS